jgi:branched-subunit amino acid aminotransferase/4-amino-4-deoxychorismate lyase
MAEQVFVSSALRGIVPAQSLDQRLLPGQPFPVMLP